MMGSALRVTCAAEGRRTKTFIESALALVGVSDMVGDVAVLGGICYMSIRTVSSLSTAHIL